MTQKSMAYDNAATVARLVHNFGMNAAGAGSATQFSKFVAFTNLLVFAVEAATSAVSTSTQTLWNGTGTVVSIAADNFSVIHVNNGTAVTTATHGPFSLSTGTATTTATVGIVTRVQLSGTGTATVQQGASVDGGFVMQPGDTLQIVRGTDATAVSVFAAEYSIQPNALVSN
jgi:hypothetical protein